MWSVVLTVFFLGSLAAAQNATDLCPPAVPRDEYLVTYLNFCFQFVLSGYKDYESAEADCELRGGTLALPKTQDISNFLVDQLIFEYNFHDRVFIGLSDSLSEGAFIWEDGTPLGPSDFSNWPPGSGPGVSTSSLEDCIAIDPNRNGDWHEYHCANELFDLITFEHAYVCQFRQRGTK